MPADWLPELLRVEPRRQVRDEGRGVLSVLPPEVGHAGRSAAGRSCPGCGSAATAAA